MDTFYENSAHSTSGPIAVYCLSTLEPSVLRSTNLIHFNVILYNRISYSYRHKFVPLHAMKVCIGENLQLHLCVVWLTNKDTYFFEIKEYFI